LTGVAHGTGGRYFSYVSLPLFFQRADFSKDPDLASLKELVDPIFAEIFSLYELEIELPQEVDEPRGWDLRLVNTAQKNQLLYQRKIAPCAAAATR
jgi:hypothetical protein